MPETLSPIVTSAPARDVDVLSEMLQAVRLTGSVFLHARFSEPFGVRAEKYYDEGMPMAQLRHISVFHLVIDGGCTFETVGGERRDVSAGDILLLPFAGEHRFWRGRPDVMANANDIVKAGAIEGLWLINHGGGGRETRLVCGYLESSEVLFAPVFRTLPPLVVERTDDDPVTAHVASTVRAIVTLVEQATPGTQAMLGRLMELLFVEVLRRHVARLPQGARGWFGALNDPVVGRALQLVHRDPARRWTIDDLARQVGSSRSVVAERFKALLGRPPIDYVTSWRIQIAAERLRASQDGIAGIAADVGYESEAAFNRAFKRIIGKTPGRWREVSRAPAAAAE